MTYNPLSQIHQLDILNIERLEVVPIIQQEFGKRIQELRKQRGLSQERFSLMIDMDRTYYSSVEAGKRNISLCNIKKIADGLGISLEELFSTL